MSSENKIDLSNFFGILVSGGIRKMAMQDTFKNAKAYSLQNRNAEKWLRGRKWNPERKYSVCSVDMNELSEIARTPII